MQNRNIRIEKIFQQQQKLPTFNNQVQSKYPQQLKKYKKMDSAQFGQFSEISFEQFLSKSGQIHCKVIGTITSITKHKKYIIEVFQNKVSVVRCYKRYTQFQLLYQNIKHRFPDYQIQQFPSKFQLFNKQQTRKSYFQNLLNQIVKDYSKENPLATKDLLETTYNFLTLHINQQKIRKQLKEQRKQKLIQDKQNKLQASITLSDDGKVKPKMQKIIRKQNSKQSKRERTSSIDFSTPSVQIFRTRSNSVSQITIDQTNQEIHQVVEPDNQFQIKFANQEDWKKGFFQVIDSSLFIFKNRNQIHFKTQIQLYRINIQYARRNNNVVDLVCDKLQLNLKRTFKQNKQLLTLYHPNDKHKLLIRRPHSSEQNKLKDEISMQKLKEKLQQASHKYPKPSNFEGVYSPIGKLFVFIHNAAFNWAKYSQSQKIWFRVNTGAMDYYSLPFSYTNRTDINQGFLIPISNTFQRVRIQCYIGKEKKDKGTLVGFFKFSMIEFFTKLNRSLVTNLQVNLQTPNKKQDYQTKLQISLENLSSVSAVVSDSYANQNDGMPIKSLSSLDDISELSLAINRIQCIVGKMNIFMRSMRRNILKFKYPVLAYFVFSMVFLNAIFYNANFFIREILIFIMLCIVYQEKYVHVLANYYLNQYVFKFIHPNFKDPQILKSAQISDLKSAHLMRYTAEDFKYIEGKLQRVNKKRQSFQFVVHGKLFTIKQDQQSFFEKIRDAKNTVDVVYKMISSIASILEKVISLFCWVDVQKTVFLIVVLFILSGIASGIMIRLIIAAVCVAKMINGFKYYNRKLYSHNRRFAIYSLRYILYKTFPDIIGDVNIHKKMDQFELNQYLSSLKFPINNQQAQRKLRAEMDKIMGLHLQPEEFYGKEANKNQLKLVYLLDVIQTCQDKLSVKFIPGQEGISDEFQQLKEETKQELQIDDWIIEKSMNFLLNIPSQLFMIYHHKQLHKIQKAQKLVEIKEGKIPDQIGKKPIDARILSAESIQKIRIQQLKQQKNQKLESKTITDPKIQQQLQVKQKLTILKQVSLL